MSHHSGMTPSAGLSGDEDALRGLLRSIASAELLRWRKRLGRIAPEQERAIRELLGSTAERISGLMIGKAREFYSSGEMEKARTLLALTD